MKEEMILFSGIKKYVKVEEIGHGALGKTVLLRDDLINQFYVCKKYQPISGVDPELYYQNFVNEIKVMHFLNHKNVVRLFNYYLYPEKYTGFIMMEYIQGKEINQFIQEYPDKINDIFKQCIEGFMYLEEQGILHRDIREANILVSDSDEVKIIDFGFGKKIFLEADFNKSITLNWWCNTPKEFLDSNYTHATEVYFVGKLFEKLISDNQIENFSYATELRGMISYDPKDRISTFKDILNRKIQEINIEDEFSYDDLESYRDFADLTKKVFSKIESSAKYIDDLDFIIKKLEDCYRKNMLEEYINNNADIARAFISGMYSYYKETNFPVHILSRFIKILKNSNIEKRKIILLNLKTRLDNITRYQDKGLSDDVPF
ncbi:MAG: protein kinase family protein [Smithellaceae bacterium]